MTTDSNPDLGNTAGSLSDSAHTVRQIFGELCDKFEIYSYRNAATILKGSFPSQYSEIVQALEEFQISADMIRQPGGSKGPIAKYVDTLFKDGWEETQIKAKLDVSLIPASSHSKKAIANWKRPGFLDGHRIDFLKGKVALDLEWNSKDQTYDRDLTAFGAYYEVGAIDVGIILTRGSDLNNEFFKQLGNVLNKDGSTGSAPVVSKFGASTTWMGKLLYRLEAGRNNGCPILAIGITPACISS